VNVRLVVAAAGMGLRLGLEQPKALALCGGKPLLIRTLARFDAAGLLSRAVITVPPGAESAFEAILHNSFAGNDFVLVTGGKERQESVERALDQLDQSDEIVVIHDAARPFVSHESITDSIEAAAEYGAATVAIPCADTILAGGADDMLEDTPDRRRLWACQTPQTFRVEVIKQAHRYARSQGFAGTDDATLVRRMGAAVKLVRGTPLNFKVTTPDDLALAEAVVTKGLA